MVKLKSIIQVSGVESVDGETIMSGFTWLPNNKRISRYLSMTLIRITLLIRKIYTLLQSNYQGIFYIYKLIEFSTDLVLQHY